MTWKRTNRLLVTIDLMGKKRNVYFQVNSYKILLSVILNFSGIIKFLQSSVNFEQEK